MQRVGFSLAEVVLAVFLISTLAVVLIGVIPSTIIGVRRENQRADAVWLAREVLEETHTIGVKKLRLANAVAYPDRSIAGVDFHITYDVSLPSFPHTDAYAPPMPVEGTYSAYLVDVYIKWEFRNVKREHHVRSVVNRGY